MKLGKKLEKLDQERKAAQQKFEEAQKKRAAALIGFMIKHHLKMLHWSDEAWKNALEQTSAAGEDAYLPKKGQEEETAIKSK